MKGANSESSGANPIDGVDGPGPANGKIISDAVSNNGGNNSAAGNFGPGSFVAGSSSSSRMPSAAEEKKKKSDSFWKARVVGKRNSDSPHENSIEGVEAPGAAQSDGVSNESGNSSASNYGPGSSVPGRSAQRSHAHCSRGEGEEVEILLEKVLEEMSTCVVRCMLGGLDAMHKYSRRPAGFL